MMSRSHNRSAAAGRALDGCRRAYGGQSPMVPAGRRKRVRFVVVAGIEAMWTWRSWIRPIQSKVRPTTITRILLYVALAVALALLLRVVVGYPEAPPSTDETEHNVAGRSGDVGRPGAHSNQASRPSRTPSSATPAAKHSNHAIRPSLLTGGTASDALAAVNLVRHE